MGQPSVARSLFRGLVAGVAGTAAMTAAQLVAAKLRGQDGGTPVPESWEDAPAPAQVAKKGAAALGEGDRIRREHVPALTNAMHWAYGVGWGAVYGLAARRARPTPVAGAAALGGGIWAAQYAGARAARDLAAAVGAAAAGARARPLLPRGLCRRRRRCLRRAHLTRSHTNQPSAVFATK